MTVTSLSDSNASLQSLIQAQASGRIGGHRSNDHDADDGGGGASAAAAPVAGGFMISLLQALQQALSTQAPAAASSIAATDASSAATATAPGASSVGVTTAKDLGNFLQQLFQAMRAADASAGTVSATANVSATSGSSGTGSIDTGGSVAAAAPADATAAATTAVAGAPTTTGASPVDSDGGNNTASAAGAGSHHHHHHGIGAYRNTLVSGLQAVLQQLKSGSAGTGSGGAATALDGLNSAFSTLMQDLSGTPGDGVAVGNTATASAALQSFLGDLVGNLQSAGHTAPLSTGTIVSTTA
jgi:hypothetical protein